METEAPLTVGLEKIDAAKIKAMQDGCHDKACVSTADLVN